jgi:hypothetical protein
MKDERIDRHEENNEPDYYQNGQSDVEKLMRHHLQTPGHVISDEELKNLKMGVSDEGEQPASEHPEAPEEDVKGFGEKQEGDTKGSTWDVLGS